MASLGSGAAWLMGSQAARAFAARYSGPRIDGDGDGDEEEVDIELVPCPTIAEIHKHDAALHVMPLENSIQGGVIETLDCLLSVFDESIVPEGQASTSASSSSSSIHKDSRALSHATATTLSDQREILMDLALPIRHCLVAKKGTRIEDVRWVRSHEQALGQSSQFISKHMPNAKPQPWPSTAAAAVSLLTPQSSTSTSTSSTSSSASTSTSTLPASEVTPNDQGAAAAICSKGVIRLYPELEVLYEGTQAIEHNYTRFLLLGPKHLMPPTTASPKKTHPQSQPQTTFFAVRNPRSLGATVVANPVMSMHVRPAPANVDQKERFPARYLVEMARYPELPHMLATSGNVTNLGSVLDTITDQEIADL